MAATNKVSVIYLGSGVEMSGNAFSCYIMSEHYGELEFRRMPVMGSLLLKNIIDVCAAVANSYVM